MQYTKILTHGSVLGSLAAGCFLAAGAAIGHIPWPVWAAWGALSVGSIAQAVRDAR